MKKSILLFAGVFIALAVAAARGKADSAADQSNKVEKIVTATSVDNLEPVGERKEFESSVGNVYCWTKITSSTVPATIKHLWYSGDKKVFEQSLDLKFTSTRTWSGKSVKTGSWRVDVTDDSGTVLSSVSFTVK